MSAVTPVWYCPSHGPPLRSEARRACIMAAGPDGKKHPLRVVATDGRSQRVRARAVARASCACRYGQGLPTCVEGRGVFLLEGRELPMEAGNLLVAPEGVHTVYGIPARSGCWSWPSWRPLPDRAVLAPVAKPRPRPKHRGGGSPCKYRGFQSSQRREAPRPSRCSATVYHGLLGVKCGSVRLQCCVARQRPRHPCTSPITRS